MDPINKLIDTVEFDAVFYSLDWHPADHVSFIDNIKQRPIHPTSPVSRYRVRCLSLSTSDTFTVRFRFNIIHYEYYARLHNKSTLSCCNMMIIAVSMSQCIDLWRFGDHAWTLEHVRDYYCVQMTNAISRLRPSIVEILNSPPER